MSIPLPSRSKFLPVLLYVNLCCQVNRKPSASWGPLYLNKGKSQIQVGAKWKDWGQCGQGTQGPQDAARRDSVKHQLVPLLLALMMVRTGGSVGGAGRMWTLGLLLIPEPPACTLNICNFFFKCRNDHIIFLVQPPSGSTSHWKQNLNSSPWFRRPSSTPLSYFFFDFSLLTWPWRCPGPLHTLLSFHRAGSSSLGSNASLEPTLTTLSKDGVTSLTLLRPFWIFILWHSLHSVIIGLFTCLLVLCLSPLMDCTFHEIRNFVLFIKDCTCCIMSPQNVFVDWMNDVDVGASSWHWFGVRPLWGWMLRLGWQFFGWLSIWQICWTPSVIDSIPIGRGILPWCWEFSPWSGQAS